MFGASGRKHAPLPPLTDAQSALAEQLRRDVVMLAETIGPRNTSRPRAYDLAADFIERVLTDAGLAVERQVYRADRHDCANLIAELPGAGAGAGTGGRHDAIIVIGAHYDTIAFTPGANDNASGVAALLAIARAVAAGGAAPPPRTVRFVAFANEEPPFFHSDLMGSVVYARRCKERGERIAAMIAFDGLGCYRDEPGTQQYPVPMAEFVYPNAGNFISFIANMASSGLLKQVAAAFGRATEFVYQAAALPGDIPGVGFSDHWSFWQLGYPAVMVTDTLPYRDPYYHSRDDTPDKLDYGRMARVVEGLIAVTRDLAGSQADVA